MLICSKRLICNQLSYHTKYCTLILHFYLPQTSQPYNASIDHVSQEHNTYREIVITCRLISHDITWDLMICDTDNQIMTAILHRIRMNELKLQLISRPFHYSQVETFYNHIATILMQRHGVFQKFLYHIRRDCCYMQIDLIWHYIGPQYL